jgi:hypothetical protein
MPTPKTPRDNETVSKSIAPLSDEDHAAAANLLGGTPVILRDAHGNEQPAIRLPDGEILINNTKQVEDAIAIVRQRLLDASQPRTRNVRLEIEVTQVTAEFAANPEALARLVERALSNAVQIAELEKRLSKLEK